jgi:hypothetical protein
MKFHTLPAFLIFLFITACNGTFKIGLENLPTNTSTQAPVFTETRSPSIPSLPTDTQKATSATFAPSNTPAPAAMATLAPSKTPVPLDTFSAAPTSMVPNYIDDRSTPSQVVVSLYSAINRQEYLRAYNYWNNPSTSQASFTAFANGYQNTASVDLVFGQISGDAGAGQLYYTVPVILKTTSKDGTHTNFGACYIAHQA